MQDIFEIKKLNTLSTQFKVKEINAINDSDNINFECDNEFEIVNKIYYELAAAIGVISGGLDILFAQEFSLENFSKIGKEEAEKLIFKHAKKNGYEGDKIDGAIRRLEKEFKWCGDEVENKFGGGKIHHFRDFTHYASVFGWIFALIAQFTKKVWGLDNNGILICVELSNELIGKTKKQKFEFATIIWTLHIVSDIAGNSGSVKKGSNGTGVPGNIISALESLSIILKKTGLIKNNENWADELAKKIFCGIKNADSDIKIDKRFEMGLNKYLKSQAFPIILNELSTRAVFSVCKLYYELKEKNIKKIDDIDKIDFKEIVPVSNRVLTRMLSISSFTFMIVNSTKATAKAIIAGGQPCVFFRNINYIGVGRFAIAIWCDKDYIANDWKKYLKYYKKRKLQLAKMERVALANFKYFKLNKKETRILYSMKIQKVLYDIQNTKSVADVNEKRKWLDKFMCKIKEDLNIKSDNYFFMSREEVFARANRLLKKHWYNTLFRKDYDSILLFSFTMQLMVFDRYDNFDADDNFKIKFVTNFEKDNFEKIQKILTLKDCYEIKKIYDGYKSAVSGNLIKIGTTLAVATLTMTATGGIALVFAPTIAVGLVGSGIALNGITLTNASLAIIGGGSLAVGGFGIFGGTAIITGGGALIGLLGSGIASSTTMKLFIASNQILYQCAELLTYSKIMIAEKCQDYKYLKNIEKLIHEAIEECDNQIMFVDNNKEEKIDKKIINCIKESRTYLYNSEKELKKIEKEYIK